MKRLDQILVQQQLAPSRTQAQKLISAGLVRVLQSGVANVIRKASSKFPEDISLQLEQGEEQRFVSRAGLKLEGVLTRLAMSVEGKTVLDVGQSTGGFTDCLLQHGAFRVVGIDVGYNQLASPLREDSRVTCIEDFNARSLSPDVFVSRGLPEKFDLIVMDVSFISQTLILPQLIDVMCKDALLVSLVKPQFEVGPEGIGKGGIVKGESWYPKVEAKITEYVQNLGMELIDYSESVLAGGDGNREFFVVARRV